jgi:hypothetical protein
MSQLQRTVPPEMDPQLRGDSPQRHAGPLIGILRTWGLYIALTHVCTMDIQCLNKGCHCMPQLQRTVARKIDPQLRGDSPHRHAGPLIGRLETWGLYIALTRVCTIDIQCLNNKSPGMSLLQRTVPTRMNLQLRGDSPCHHAGPLIGMLSTWVHM